MLDWIGIDCSLVGTSSEATGSEQVGLMKGEDQVFAVAYASGGAETYSFMFIDMKEQVVNRYSVWELKLRFYDDEQLNLVMREQLLANFWVGAKRENCLSPSMSIRKTMLVQKRT